MKSPVFIFSLPRSGSTLLQRVLMTHKSITSLSEPWILLPQIYAYNKTASLSEYSSFSSQRGIANFIKNLPLENKDYEAELNKFMLNLYKKQCKNGELYFLDKTPRYYLIIDEIVRIFPNAKFIFLFRGPEKILSSMMTTWGSNGFKSFLTSYHDVTEGFEILSQAYEKYKSISVKVNYENFVANPEAELLSLMNYLELEFDINLINDFWNQDLKGQLGDPTGVKKYKSISQKSLDAWKENFNTIYRKKIAYKIVKEIDESSFLTQGYDKKDILNQIKELKSNLNIFRNFRDVFYYAISKVTRRYNLHLFFYKNYKWFKQKTVT